MKTSTKILVGVGIAAGLTGGVFNKASAQELVQSRMETGAYNNKVLNFDPDGKYMLAGMATSTAIALDSVRVSQQVSLDLSKLGDGGASFKLFGQLDVEAVSYEKGKLVLQPTNGKVKTIVYEDGKALANYEGWTANVNEISKNGNNMVLSIEAANTSPGTVAIGDTLKGPFGVDLTPAEAPPYSQIIVSSKPAGYTIQTTNGPVVFDAPVYVGVVLQDTLAENNPLKQSVFNESNGTRYVTDFVMFANEKTGKKEYYFLEVGTSRYVKNTGSVSINEPPKNMTLSVAYIFKMPASGEGPQVNRNVDLESGVQVTYLNIRTVKEGGIYKNAPTFSIMRHDYKTNKDSVLETGLTAYNNPNDNHTTFITDSTIVTKSDAHDPRPDAKVVRGLMVEDSVTSVPEYPLQNGYIKAHPNPLNGTLNVEVMGRGQTWINLYDMQGRVVANLFNGVLYEGQAENMQKDLSALPAGTYIVGVGGQSGKKEGIKVIKE